MVITVDGKVHKIGDTNVNFSLQSTSKPFTYGLVLEDPGRDDTLKKVGVEPTGEAFNSIVELEKKTHRPEPGLMGIAVYSPNIVEKSHSVRGLKVFQEISKTLNFSIFSGEKILC